MTSPRVLYLCGWPMGAHGEGAVSFVYEQIDALSRNVLAAYAEHCFEGITTWTRRWATGRDVESITDLWPAPVAAARFWTPRWSPRLTKRDLLDDVWNAGEMVGDRATRLFGPIDIVHAHVVLPAGLLGAAVAQSLQVPLVVQEHSGPFSMHLDTESKRAAVNKTLRAATVVCAVGDELAMRIEAQREAQDVRVVPNLVRTELFATAAVPHDRSCLRLVSVGSLEKIKELDVLIDAVSMLERSGMRIELRIVGAGTLRDTLSAHLARLGIDPTITLLGARSRAETARIVAESHIYVCSSSHETFGIAPAEALSVGRPVVSTRCGGPEHFVDDSCGALVEPGDARAMADAIAQTWKCIDTFAPAQMHARIDERFGPDAFRRRMLALYEEVRSARVAA
ncbi:MAG: glycosyltransferase [Gemmatimonadaceae bacterium]